MAPRYRIVASAGFERDVRGLRKHAPRVLDALIGAAGLLREDPFNLRGHANIRKLVDVRPGEGQFRLRLGVWRLRYDVVGADVVLHSMRHRRESYRP
jgi:mRNA-degrading endonuclease RelE of RelBE toxin-antitoxin system